MNLKKSLILIEFVIIMLVIGILGVGSAFAEMKQIGPKDTLIDYNDKNDIISYRYFTNKEVKESLGEDISKRTSNSQTFLKENSIVIKIYASDQFYKENDKWFQIEYATTTKENFEKNDQVGWFKNLVYPTVRAMATSVYSGAGDGGSGISWGTWNDMHDSAAGSVANDTDTTINGIDGYIKIQHRTDKSGYKIGRGFVPFDTSGLPDDAVISSSTAFLYASGAAIIGDNDAQAYVGLIASTTQADPTEIVVNDYDECGEIDNPLLGAPSVNLNDISGTGYIEFILNANGIKEISLTGYTLFGIREGHDIEDIAIANDTSNVVIFRSSEQAGTNEDPFILIEYTSESGEDTEEATITERIIIDQETIIILFIIIGIIVFVDFVRRWFAKETK